VSNALIVPPGFPVTRRDRLVAPVFIERSRARPIFAVLARIPALTSIDDRAEQRRG